MTTFRSAKVEGLDVFYRRAGDPSKPKLLLLGGFPSSSHQFRNPIPAELVRLDSGHFAVEDNLDLIAETIVRFYDAGAGSEENSVVS